MRRCEYRHCGTDLDQLPQVPRADAKFCCPAHKTAEHRLRKLSESDQDLTDVSSPDLFPWSRLSDSRVGPRSPRRAPR